MNEFRPDGKKSKQSMLTSIFGKDNLISQLTQFGTQFVKFGVSALKEVANKLTNQEDIEKN